MSLMSQRQPTITFSTTKEKYTTNTHNFKEAIWLQEICNGIGFDFKIVMIRCDSQSSICLTKNPMYHIVLSMLMFNFTLCEK